MPDGVIDLGGGKAANGNEAIAAVVKTPEHQAAIAGGLCHFTGLPRVELDGDTRGGDLVSAGASRRPQGRSPMEVSGQGCRAAIRIHRRRRQPLGSQAHRGRLEGDPASLPLLDGSDGARELLRQAVAK